MLVRGILFRPYSSSIQKEGGAGREGGRMPRKGPGRDKDKPQSPGRKMRPATGAEAMPQVWLPDQVRSLTAARLSIQFPSVDKSILV